MEYPSNQTNAPRTNTMALVSLVTGILGLIGVLPLIGSIIAIVTGNMAKKEIETNPGMYSGEGMARGGQILGWIGVVLGALACCGFLVFLIFFGGLAALGLSTETGLLLPALMAF